MAKVFRSDIRLAVFYEQVFREAHLLYDSGGSSLE
jgi:hypothetical protein